MIHETQPGHGLGDDVAHFCRLEGARISQDDIQELEEEQLGRRIDQIRDTLLSVVRAGMIPLDFASEQSTHVFLHSIEAIRRVDPQGTRFPLQDWERTWLSQQMKGDTQTPETLRGVSQIEMVELWLIDALFPIRAIQEAEKVHPGFSDIWMNHFRHVAQEIKFSPAREMLFSAADGASVGVLALLPKEYQQAASWGQIGIMGFLSGLDQKTTQRYNYLYGVLKDLAVELRTIFGRQVGMNTPVLNTDTLVQEIVSGGIAELDFRLATIGVWSMLAGVGTASAAVRLPLHGLIKGTVDTTIVIAASIAAIKTADHPVLHRALEPFLKTFGGIQQAIILDAAAHESEAKISGTLIGEKKSISGQAEQRDAVTFDKNMFTTLVKLGVPQFIIAAVSAITHDEWAGVSVSIGPAIRRALDRLGSYMSYQSAQTTRHASRETLIRELVNMRRAIYGTRNDEQLAPWQKEEHIDWAKQGRTFTFKSIGMTPYKRASDGVEITTVQFQNGFDVTPQDVVPIFGGNGSGKSKLAAVVSGIRSGKLSDTDVRLGGVDLRQMSAEEYKRRFKLVRSSEHDSLRQLLASALLYKGTLRGHRLNLSIDVSQLLSWSQGKASYAELEEEVERWMKTWGVKIHESISWHDTSLGASGMQRAMANALFHMFLTEPVTLFIDEAGGEFDAGWTKTFISFLHERAKQNESPGAIFVCVNKDPDLWWREKGRLYIDMSQPVQGRVRMRTTSETDVYDEMPEQIRKALLDRYERMFTRGEVMEPKELREWMELGPGRELDMQIQTHPDREKEYPFYFTESSGTVAFEDRYSSYVEHCIQQWVKTYVEFEGIDRRTSRAKQNEHVVDMLHALNAVYGREIQFKPNYNRESRECIAGRMSHRWNALLTVRPLVNILQPVLTHHKEKIRHARSWGAETASYPQTYGERRALLESLAVLQLFMRFADVYENRSRSVRAEFFDMKTMLTEAGGVLGAPFFRFRDHQPHGEPTLHNLQEILQDPLILYAACYANSWQKDHFQEYLYAIISSITTNEELENLEKSMREASFPVLMNSTIVEVQFWNHVNTYHRTGDRGFLEVLFDTRRGHMINK
jgi:predicted ABC-type transport system involved in lysophospholipase L1 biosynthesis ATPase subunit